MKLISGCSLFWLPLMVTAQFITGDDNNDEGEIWAVLLAGARDWDNYRYQADVAHTYQVLHANGIPDDHIIVMLYDDVANSVYNIHPGQLFNEVGGPDVYTGMPKDYIGDEVNQDTFFKVLRGDDTGMSARGSGKVLKSGPNDRIFLSMDDHGSPGCFYFPGFVPMTAIDFADVIMEIHEAGKFKEMMIYMEACEAGTMFEDLYPDEVRLYASTSSNAEEPSWAAEYDDEIGNWLACEFPLGMMRDTEAHDPAVETLQQQYDNVRESITSAHVSQYGNLDVAKSVVGAFLGNRTTAPRVSKNTKQSQRIRTEDVPLALLERQLLSAKDDTERERIRNEISSFLIAEKLVKDSMQQIALAVTADEELTDQMMEKKYIKITQWDCYGPGLQAFHQCLTEEQRQHAPPVMHTLLALCEAGYQKSQVMAAIETVCYSLQ